MKLAYSTTAALALLALPSAEALAGGDAYLGEVTLLATSFCPQGTLPATGRMLPIQPYAALFSLLGTQYGGDGKTTFALPDVAPIKTVSGQPLIACIATQGIYPSRDAKAHKAPAKKE